jgi:uncharacterized protein (TIGR03067 family)
MLRWALVLFALAGFASFAWTDSAEKELEKFQGAWSVELMEENGVKEPDEENKKFQVSIKGAQLVVKFDSKEETMSFKIDPEQNPRTIDLTPNFGEDKGKTFSGIYELDGERLRICASPKGERPKKFVSEKGTMLLVLKKKAEAER